MEKTSVAILRRASGVTGYSDRRWVNMMGSAVCGNRLMTGEHPRSTALAVTPTDNLCCRCSASNGAIRKMISARPPLTTFKGCSTSFSSKKKNFSGKAKYSCKSRYPWKDLRGYGNTDSDSENPMGRRDL